jgi:hypothetical protein
LGGGAVKRRRPAEAGLRWRFHLAAGAKRGEKWRGGKWSKKDNHQRGGQFDT